MKKSLFALAALALLPFMALKSFAAAPDALGGSAFPLIFINQPPINLTDSFNQMLQIISSQTAGLSTVYNNAIAEPSGGLDTSGVPYSNSLQANPITLGTFSSYLTASANAGTAVVLASQAGRQAFPMGGLTIMASGTATGATSVSLECQPSHAIVATWPIAQLVDHVPVGIYASSTTVLGSALNQGCPVANALVLSANGTLATTTWLGFNLPYMVQ